MGLRAHDWRGHGTVGSVESGRMYVDEFRGEARCAFIESGVGFGVGWAFSLECWRWRWGDIGDDGLS